MTRHSPFFANTSCALPFSTGLVASNALGHRVSAMHDPFLHVLDTHRPRWARQPIIIYGSTRLRSLNSGQMSLVEIVIFLQLLVMLLILTSRMEAHNALMRQARAGVMTFAQSHCYFLTHTAIRDL